MKGYRTEIDKVALRRTFVVDERRIVPVGFFVKGAQYKLWGLFPMETHLIGPLNAADPMYLLGTDRLGRDLLSRLIYGTRVSMSIGLVGVAMLAHPRHRAGRHFRLLRRLGRLVIQRIIEVVSAMPTIPLWLGTGRRDPAHLVAAAASISSSR